MHVSRRPSLRHTAPNDLNVSAMTDRSGGRLFHTASLPLVTPALATNAPLSRPNGGGSLRPAIRSERTSPLLGHFRASRRSPDILVRWELLHRNCRREFAVEEAEAEFDRQATRVGIAAGFRESAMATE